MRDQPTNPVGDRLRSSLAAVDVKTRNTRISEKLQQRLRLAAVLFQSLPDHRLAVVFTRHQSRPLQITDAFHFRGMRGQTIEGAANGTLPSPRHGGNNL